MRRRLAVLGILTLLLPPVVSSPAAAVAAPAAVPVRAAVEDTGKYYVVGPPVNGQQEFLFAIAAKTLKSGKRADEIFELNKGRLQPDGETMTDPATLKPGWILVLPSDASGPGVRNGTPPEAGGAPRATATPADAASPTGDTAPGDAANAGRPPADGSGTLDFLQSPTALRVALIVLAVLLLVWAQLALSSRRRSVRPRSAPASASGSNTLVLAPAGSGGTRTQAVPAPAPPQTDKPGKAKRRQLTALPQAASRQAPAVPAPPAAAPPQPAPPAPTPPQPVPPQPLPATPAPEATFASSIPDDMPSATMPAPPQAKPTPAKTTPAKPAAAKPAKPVKEPVFENYDSPSERSFLSAIALPRPGGALPELMPQSPPNPFPALVTDLVCGGVRASARLIGARPARWGAAHGWLAEGEAPPPATAPVVLGTHEGRRLWVDLTVAPDVLVLGGDPDAARAHGRDLAAQLAATAEVMVAGAVLGDAVPDGCRRIGSVAELHTDRPATATRVVICDATEAAALYARLRAIPASRGRTVPVVVGRAPAARWSVRLGDPVPSETGQPAVQSSAS